MQKEVHSEFYFNSHGQSRAGSRWQGHEVETTGVFQLMKQLNNRLSTESEALGELTDALTSLRWMFSFSFWSKITSKWLTWDSASAIRRVRSLSSSRLLDGNPLLCSISRSFLMDSSRALRVCFCVSILNSISSNVFRRRNSSLACLSCSAWSLRKFSSVSSMVKCSAPRLPLSCCRRWLRSLWVRSSSWRAWMVNCRCYRRRMEQERRKGESQ